jgi:hypothetical protein
MTHDIGGIRESQHPAHLHSVLFVEVGKKEKTNHQQDVELTILEFLVASRHIFVIIELFELRYFFYFFQFLIVNINQICLSRWAN